MLTPNKIMVSDLIRSCRHLRAILPRSRHLPRASTEGRARENYNEIGVRFWTDCRDAEGVELVGAKRCPSG